MAEPTAAAEPPMTRSRRARLSAESDVVQLYFKERVYATFTGLAILLVVGLEGASISHAVAALFFGVLGITVAGMVADIITHLALHKQFPRGRDMRVLLTVAGGALATVVVPGILLLLGVLGVISERFAIIAGIGVYVVTLALIGWLAVRRAKVPWWKQLIALALLLVLGLAVIGLQAFAHAI